jgi:hypothetical protein
MKNIAHGFSSLDPTIIYSWPMEDLINQDSIYEYVINMK